MSVFMNKRDARRLEITHCTCEYYYCHQPTSCHQPTQICFLLLQFAYKTQPWHFDHIFIVVFQSLFMYRVAAHVVIALIFGYLYSGVGNEASSVLGNYVYLYGSMLLVVYTGKMSVTLSCKYLHTEPFRS